MNKTNLAVSSHNLVDLVAHIASYFTLVQKFLNYNYLKNSLLKFETVLKFL